MENVKHTPTPGQWTYKLDENTNRFYITNGENGIADIVGTRNSFEANARLISLAPEMAEALREALPDLDAYAYNAARLNYIDKTEAMERFKRVIAILAKLDGKGEADGR